MMGEGKMAYFVAGTGKCCRCHQVYGRVEGAVSIKLQDVHAELCHGCVPVLLEQIQLAASPQRSDGSR
jgi:hypothetical protein